ncbi:MAG: DUF6242 domain-containing protein [Tannerella sp.]|jgi:hypothetical protein|nr:DUF6242 domain-containing protein [Tannerella sp.]
MRYYWIKRLSALGVFLLLISCLDNNTYDYDDWNLSNPQISTFSLSNDSIKGLADVKFTIDQVNGRIYNVDSMPYGTELRFKLLCSLEFEIGAFAIAIMPEATNDTIVTTTDSIDYSKPVIIKVTAYDGVTTKEYDTRLNIHQINPDSMVWTHHAALLQGKESNEVKALKFKDNYLMYINDGTDYSLYTVDTLHYTNQWTQTPLTDFPSGADISQITEYADYLYVATYAGLLYRSSDGKLWQQAAGAPEMKTLIGVLPASTTNAKTSLAGVAYFDYALKFVSMDEAGVWTTGNAVPETFPLSGFGAANYELMYYGRLVIAGGRDINGNLTDEVWSTTNSLLWAPISNPAATFSPREYTSLSIYDGKLYLQGGIGENNTPLKDLYYTEDNGVTWKLYDYPFPDDFPAGGFSSVIVTHDNYMLLFGGKADLNSKVPDEIWQGRINRLGFNK